MGDDRKSSILVQYKERSITLVSSSMNDVAQAFSSFLLGNPPYEIPKEHRKAVNRFRSDLANKLQVKSPRRNTELRKEYEKIAYESLVLLDGPYDEKGAGDIELLTIWSTYAQSAQNYGFDIKGHILLEGILEELSDQPLPLEFAVNQLLRCYGVIGSIFATPPMFTPKWRIGYIRWAFMNAAVNVTGNLPDMRYSGGN